MRPVSTLLSWASYLLLSAAASGCAGSRGAVPLLITSNAPVKATATQLRQGVLQAVKDWADAKERIEEIHSRRVAEMLAIEADITFLEEVARVDAGGPAPRGGLDVGRLETLLGLKAREPTFDEEIQRALAPARRSMTPDAYFDTYLPGLEGAAADPDRKRFATLWNRLRQLTDAQILDGPDMARWMAEQNLRSWSDLVTRFARRDERGRVVADGAMVLEAVREAARDLRVEPPDLPSLRYVTERAIARLRHRRAQFPAVDQLLSHLLTIARDLDTYLQNDVEAIHWKDVGAAIGKAQSISTEVQELGGAR